MLGEAERAHLIERITLERLDAASVHALVSALATIDDEDILHGLAQRAEGIPFFVEELSRCATATLPDTLRDLLLARYEQLSEDAAAVVRVAAASDSPLEHETLTALSGLDGPRLNDGIREAMRTGILVVDEDRYTFRHALLREAVHDELLPGERAALHRAFAEHLQGLADADPRRDLHAALAHHWQLAHDRRRALVAATAAMWSAKARYAFSTAARFGRLVLELWDQVDDAEDAAGIDRITLMLRIGSILRNAGDSERALTVVDGALTEAGTTEIDPALQVRPARQGDVSGQPRPTGCRRAAGGGAGHHGRPRARRQTERHRPVPVRGPADGRRAHRRRDRRRQPRLGLRGARGCRGADVGGPEPARHVARAPRRPGRRLRRLRRRPGTRPHPRRACATRSTTPTCWPCSGGTARR
ncbi:hypothetical protein L2X98_29615 [Microbacterium elymi]|uniref:Uncharacterized protein n=1 Tax=Microbacterium elymi TaxID=2909587 RepID=A0ABY5NHJ7_9MICO|nr:hypothetical protein [Microbacterium elymi]UUT34647.1 hypothetical protein L2X98_29615 [Microbacterium elymi]